MIYCWLKNSPIALYLTLSSLKMFLSILNLNFSLFIRMLCPIDFCLSCPVCLVRGEALSLLSFLNVASNQILSYWTIIFDNLDLSINANKQKMMTFISTLLNDGIRNMFDDYLTRNINCHNFSIHGQRLIGWKYFCCMIWSEKSISDGMSSPEPGSWRARARVWRDLGLGYVMIRYIAIIPVIISTFS